MNIAAFEQSWSVIVSIVSNPSDSGVDNEIQGDSLEGQCVGFRGDG